MGFEGILPRMAAMNLKKARYLADHWVELLRPHCEQIEIAGSIRRGVAQVKDIEIVARPRVVVQQGFFGDREASNINTEIAAIAKREKAAFVKDGPRYKQIKLPQGINLDLFLVFKPATWGVIFTIRTGPASFSRAIVTPKFDPITGQQWQGHLPQGFRIRDGVLFDPDLQAIPTEDELDLFAAIGLSWIEPKDRH